MGADITNIAKSGLMTAKLSMQTSSHNMANANTEGFSRQISQINTRNPIGYGPIVIGSGNDVTAVSRINDKFIEEKINSKNSDLVFYKERMQQLSSLENIFNEINREGFAQVLNKFFNSFRELSIRPSDPTIRFMVRENAEILSKEFRRIRTSMDELTALIDKNLEKNVDDINYISERIAQLNFELRRLEMMHGESGDLRDERDRMIRKLSGYFKIKAFDDDRGHYNIYIEGIGTIVSASKFRKLEIGPVATGTDAYKTGLKHVFINGKKGQPIDGKIPDGQIKALLETRDEEINFQKRTIDSIAHKLVLEVNKLHQRGHGIGESASGGLFFNPISDVHNAAHYVGLTEKIKEDANNMAMSDSPKSPGNNKIAIEISNLQNEKVFADNTTTFEDEYSKGVGLVSLELRKAIINKEQFDGIVAQMKTTRERISGVSIDEETVNMIKQQHAYDANAKVLQVANEMFDSVLSIKR